VYLSLEETLESVYGPEHPVFPPTYCAPKGGEQKDKSLYMVSSLGEGKNICTMDSVGSQANRVEPMFMHEPYCTLVPQVTVTLPSGQVLNVLELPHRAADAAIRFSDLSNSIAEALQLVRSDLSVLAKLFPTSLIFGCWDSRETKIKLPRLFSSEVVAYDVHEVRRSAIYTPPVEYIEHIDLTEEELGDKSDDKSMGAQLGLTMVPSTGVLGGVVCREIKRRASFNVTGLRTHLLRAQRSSVVVEHAQAQERAVRYLLGLGLTALTAPMDYSFRSGCQLVCTSRVLQVVANDGTKTSISLDHDQVRAWAQAAADACKFKNKIEAKFSTAAVRAKISEQAKKNTEKSDKKKGKKGTGTEAAT
jgi:CRISPR-associated protein Csb1